MLREEVSAGECGGHFYLAYYADERAARSGKKPKGQIDLDDCEQVDVGWTVEGNGAGGGGDHGVHR